MNTANPAASYGTIPKIIHQVWKSNTLPDYASDCWQKVGQDWEWRIWTDADLLALVENHYPQWLDLYTSYPYNIQRADLGRYLILDHCGGFYTDLDTEYLGGLDTLVQDNRVILCEEPFEHFFNHIKPFGLDRLYFNGTMAGPAKHPFWAHLIGYLVKCRHARAHVLESTGPIVLTGAVMGFVDQAQLSLNSCHLFCPLTSFGVHSTAPQHGPLAPLRVSNHLWRGTWWKKTKRTNVLKAVKSLVTLLRRSMYLATRGPQYTRSMAAAYINHAHLQNPVPAGGQISILIPVRDGAPFLGRCMELLTALDYPRDQLSLTFCEGDSTDNTVEMLQEISSRHAQDFSSINVITFQGGPTLERARRWLPKKQYERRAHLAKVRNHLIDFGLHPRSDWALWLDADVCDYPSNILHVLLQQNAKIVTPDCRLSWDGPSFDLNAFCETNTKRDSSYLKHVKNGLFMPPANFGRRRHLHDMRCVDSVPLTSVGGTMLLVAAQVHRAGIRFPDIPYQDLLETEGFGRLCHDFGIPPIGLPNTAILHRPD